MNQIRLKKPKKSRSLNGCGLVFLIECNRDSKSDRDQYGIGENLIRFSFGVEDFDDLKADIVKGLEAI